MFFYHFFMTLILFGIYPSAWLLSLFNQKGLLQRLTPPGNLPDDEVRRIWIHAASVGESVIAFSLARELRRRKPGCLIFVSTTTRTGLERMWGMNGQAGGHVVERAFLAPFDHPFIVGRFLRKLQPSLFILIETEIWPSLVATVHRHDVPIVIVNGKLSQRAFRRYRMVPLIRGVMHRLMEGISLVCVQSRSFARRYRMLGIHPERIEILGNIKFDSLPDPGVFNPAVIRSALGIPHSAKIFVAGRPGEEEIIAAAFALGSEKKCPIRL